MEDTERALPCLSQDLKGGQGKAVPVTGTASAKSLRQERRQENLPGGAMSGRMGYGHE